MPSDVSKGEQLEITLEANKTQSDEVFLTTYEYDEVIEKSKKYFNGDELAANVWVSKYAPERFRWKYL